MEKVQTQGAQKKGALAAARVRGWEADARSQKGSPVNPDRHQIERRTSATVGAREETPLARRWEPLGPIWRQHPRNANPD